MAFENATTRAVEKAFLLLCSLPGSSLGAQLERMRLGLTQSHNPQSAENSAIYTVDSTFVGVLAGLTDREQLALYLRYYWRPGYEAETARVRGRAGKTVVVESRSPTRSSLGQCAEVMGLSERAFRRLLERAHSRCAKNLSRNEYVSHTTGEAKC